MPKILPYTIWPSLASMFLKSSCWNILFFDLGNVVLLLGTFFFSYIYILTPLREVFQLSIESLCYWPKLRIFLLGKLLSKLLLLI